MSSTIMSGGLPEWAALLRRLGHAGPVRDVILESWGRSRAAGVDTQNTPLQRVPDAELERRLAASAQLLDSARPYLDWISALIAATPHVVYVTDRDGVVLLSTGNDPLLVRQAGLDPGFDWSEQRMGTNGAGTALATGQPQAVVGAEHYLEAFSGCACTAAPIFDPDGELVGAIDISTVSLNGVPERMLLVTHAAHVIQRDFEARRMAVLAERRALEAEEARRTLDALLEHIPEGITIASAPDVRILRVSRHGMEMTGRAPTELKIPSGGAAHSTAWGILHPDGTPAKDEELPLTRAVRDGTVSTDEEWLIRRPDGTTITILANAGPIRDADGVITGGVIAWRDVSSRKQAELQLFENEARMRDLYEAARAAARAREEVVAVVSHDLRNPLNVIMTGATLLSEFELTEEKKARQVQAIASSARAMHVLIDDLLDATRMKAGSFRVRPRAVEPQPLLEEVTATFRPVTKEKGLSLRTHVAEPLEPLRADPDRLLQVLNNLLSNATRHSPSGGTVHVRVEQNAEHHVITVADDGPGIPAADRPHLFDKFWQGPDRYAGSAGLGLAICKGIVEAHGGRIWLDPDVQRGATIRFTLPRAAADV